MQDCLHGKSQPETTGVFWWRLAMELNKTYRLGELIEHRIEQNTDGQYNIKDVRGLSIQKEFISTKANMKGVSLNSYLLVYPRDFAYITVTSRNSDKITLAFNYSTSTYLVSSTYEVFYVKNTEILLPEYLCMFFNRIEFDRYSRFHSWGSARETFLWDDLCATKITLPPLPAQRRAVAIYQDLKDNLAAYEQGIENLKLTCDGYIEDLTRKLPRTKIGPYLEYSDNRNEFGLELSSVRGLSIEKKLIPTKADMKGVSLDKYKTLAPKQFSYVPVTSRNGGKITIALNDSEETYLVSSAYEVFGTKESELNSDYLMMFFNQSEFDRYARFHSWGSARETFDWPEMCNVKIPLPNIKIQQSIADIYKCYIERKRIAEELRLKLQSICPVLLRGALANRGVNGWAS